MTTPVIDVPPGRLAWLDAQLTAWQASGLVEASQAQAIRAQYTASRRFSLGRLALYLGGTFIGIGVLWLIAANLDQIPPGVRFTAITLIWLTTMVGAEALAARHHDEPSPLVGAIRGLAAIAFGGVIMQAAQSLQVPAWEPLLVGLWGLGALIHAYAMRAVAPLVIGLVLSSVWMIWQYGEESEVAGVVTALITIGVAGSALALLHRFWDRLTPGFVTSWRLLGALGLLAGVFIAALPIDGSLSLPWTGWLLPVAAAALLVAAIAVAGRAHPWEAPVPAAAAVLAGVLLAWETTRDPWSGVTAGDWLHALVAVGGYLLLATGIAAWGVLHDHPALTWVAVAGLVVFTIVQSFTVFAAVIEGAWLFVVLGLILLGTGWLVDRGRRRLVAVMEGDAA
ncbi:DUF2157 domain-containing protein [Nocardioides limicola]|uniref:DUF2157 domain-containing protein n=1 Tax=Nocardioides limicola TaxID=2803368 RepID=UPI00193C2CA3|nr:DUF2157 domain-containing protein [Nocardioides sp. DJM-14]